MPGRPTPGRGPPASWTRPGPADHRRTTRSTSACSSERWPSPPRRLAPDAATDRPGRRRSRATASGCTPEVEQRPAAPFVGRERTPGGQALQRCGPRSARSGPMRPGAAQQLDHQRRVGEVLGVQQPLAVGARRRRRAVGLVQRPAQRLFDHHRRARVEQPEGVGGMLRRVAWPPPRCSAPAGSSS